MGTVYWYRVNHEVEVLFYSPVHHYEKKTHANPLNLVLGLLGTAQQTGSAGSNKTGFLTLYGISGDGRGFTNVLMVTTTVGLDDVSTLHA